MPRTKGDTSSRSPYPSAGTDLHNVCERADKKLDIAWPEALTETTRSRYEGKRLPKAKALARQLLLVFPECLEEDTRSWTKPLSTKNPIQGGSSLDWVDMEVKGFLPPAPGRTPAGISPPPHTEVHHDFSRPNSALQGRLSPVITDRERRRVGESADRLDSTTRIPGGVTGRHVDFTHPSHRLKSKKKTVFSENLKQFATTLHFYSPKAYDYVREKFHLALPHPQTIRKWYISISADPGFTVASFIALKSYVAEEKKAGKDTVCALMMDEMCIHKQTEFGGVFDIGAGEMENVVATQALVLMVIAINESWKIPIAYFLINIMRGAERANLIRESLVRLHESGVRVVSLTCQQTMDEQGGQAES
ncbi:hypothetical protein F2P81_007468 [Scophthalmus maximus]|uniref:THAP-type domain-containing protein n=1 Tax=Scophthalmus maximus TaxID=52904 RepID=A0A6A4SZG6_SCOMX|nr:hypothetical protein F2P81_007468 [Scophthalmus maximus]